MNGFRKWFTAPHVATLMLVLLVAIVVAGFVLVLQSQTREVLQNRQVAKCILAELQNHRDRSEDIYAAFASFDEDALRDLLEHPPESAFCFNDFRE